MKLLDKYKKLGNQVQWKKDLRVSEMTNDHLIRVFRTIRRKRLNPVWLIILRDEMASRGINHAIHLK